MNPEITELNRISYTLNPNDLGACSMMVRTAFLNDSLLGDDIQMCQEIVLHSFSNSASFTLLSGIFTPANLRELANQIESGLIEAKHQLMVKKQLT